MGGWLDVVVNVVCLSLVIWKTNNNVESPTSPEQRRPSKRVRISVVVRATDLGHAPNAWKPPGNRFISQSADCHPIIPLHRRANPRMPMDRDGAPGSAEAHLCHRAELR